MLILNIDQLHPGDQDDMAIMALIERIRGIALTRDRLEQEAESLRAELKEKDDQIERYRLERTRILEAIQLLRKRK